MAKAGIIRAELRLVMLDDFVQGKDSLVDELDIEKIGAYNEKPSHCPCCKSDRICGIEIMGGYDGILFWECDTCEKMFFRFDPEETEKYLQSAKEIWTNPRDWGHIPRSKFN